FYHYKKKNKRLAIRELFLWNFRLLRRIRTIVASHLYRALPRQCPYLLGIFEGNIRRHRSFYLSIFWISYSIHIRLYQFAHCYFPQKEQFYLKKMKAGCCIQDRWKYFGDLEFPNLHKPKQYQKHKLRYFPVQS